MNVNRIAEYDNQIESEAYEPWVYDWISDYGLAELVFNYDTFEILDGGSIKYLLPKEIQRDNYILVCKFLMETISEFSMLLPESDSGIYDLYEELCKLDTVDLTCSFPEFYERARKIQIVELKQTNYYRLLDDNIQTTLE